MVIFPPQYPSVIFLDCTAFGYMAILTEERPFLYPGTRMRDHIKRRCKPAQPPMPSPKGLFIIPERYCIPLPTVLGR